MRSVFGRGLTATRVPAGRSADSATRCRRQSRGPLLQVAGRPIQGGLGRDSSWRPAKPPAPLRCLRGWLVCTSPSRPLRLHHDPQAARRGSLSSGPGLGSRIAGESSVILLRKSVLQTSVPELVNRTSLSENLPREGRLKHWHEAHRPSFQAKHYLRERQQ